MDDTERVLRELSVIAVVGLSRDPAKPAHSVPAGLKAAGFRIVPVNPEAKELLGELHRRGTRAVRNQETHTFLTHAQLANGEFRQSAAATNAARRATTPICNMLHHAKTRHRAT